LKIHNNNHHHHKIHTKIPRRGEEREGGGEGGEGGRKIKIFSNGWFVTI